MKYQRTFLSLFLCIFKYLPIKNIFFFNLLFNFKIDSGKGKTKSIAETPHFPHSFPPSKSNPSFCLSVITVSVHSFFSYSKYYISLGYISKTIESYSKWINSRYILIRYTTNEFFVYIFVVDWVFTFLVQNYTKRSNNICILLVLNYEAFDR